MIIINAVHKAGTFLIDNGNFSRSLKKIQPLVLVQGPLHNGIELTISTYEAKIEVTANELKHYHLVT